VISTIHTKPESIPLRHAPRRAAHPSSLTTRPDAAHPQIETLVKSGDRLANAGQLQLRFGRLLGQRKRAVAEHRS
jgi:hypothetical protein